MFFRMFYDKEVKPQEKIITKIAKFYFDFNIQSKKKIIS